MHQIAKGGPLKLKHSGIKGNIGLPEDMNVAAIRSIHQELMPNLPDGGSFFEGTIHLNSQDEVVRSVIRICNST